MSRRKVFKFEPTKFPVIATVKSAKPALTCLNFPSKDQRQTIRLFGADGTHCFAKTNEPHL